MKRILSYLFIGCCGLNAQAPSLQETLRKTGAAVEEFWENFASINCRETVSQSKLSREGKVIAGRESAFDYVVLLRASGADLAVEESRDALGAKASGKSAPLLVTSGFSTLLFVFHPQYQNSFEYTPPVEEEIEGRRAVRVAFRQAKEGRAMTCLRLRGREIPLEWAGTAWIDPLAGHILKISARLQPGTDDLGLEELKAEVSYAPVKFRDVREEQWLPAVATIEARTPGQRWVNVHRFAAYKRFSVATSARAEAPEK